MLEVCYVIHLMLNIVIRLRNIVEGLELTAEVLRIRPTDRILYLNLLNPSLYSSFSYSFLFNGSILFSL